MTLYASLDEASQWICMGCNADLVVGKVEVHYMGSGYPVDLSRCPNCGQRSNQQKTGLQDYLLVIVPKKSYQFLNQKLQMIPDQERQFKQQETMR